MPGLPTFILACTFTIIETLNPDAEISTGSLVILVVLTAVLEVAAIYQLASRGCDS